jgi:hypothetical protein
MLLNKHKHFPTSYAFSGDNLKVGHIRTSSGFSSTKCMKFCGENRDSVNPADPLKILGITP